MDYCRSQSSLYSSEGERSPSVGESLGLASESPPFVPNSPSFPLSPNSPSFHMESNKDPPPFQLRSNSNTFSFKVRLLLVFITRIILLSRSRVSHFLDVPGIQFHILGPMIANEFSRRLPCLILQPFCRSGTLAIVPWRSLSTKVICMSSDVRP